MTVIADFFRKIRNPENVVRYMSKKSPFKGPFESQYGKGVQRLCQSAQQHCHHI